MVLDNHRMIDNFNKDGLTIPNCEEYGMTDDEWCERKKQDDDEAEYQSEMAQKRFEENDESPDDD